MTDQERLVKQALKLVDRYPTPWECDDRISPRFFDANGKCFMRLEGGLNVTLREEANIAKAIIACVNNCASLINQINEQ